MRAEMLMKMRAETKAKDVRATNRRTKIAAAAAVAVLAAAFATQAAWGQGATAAPAPAPAMAPAGPPMPNPALKQVQFFVGSWQCAGTGYMEGKGHPITAKVNMGWDLNGFFLNLRYQEDKTAVNPMPITAVEHWGYSDELKKLVAGQVDSMGGYGTQATAGWEGDRMVWVGDVHMMGTKMPSRDTFVKRGDNEVSHLGEIQEDNVWTKQDEQTCFRLAVK
jgi:hypothetical protein